MSSVLEHLVALEAVLAPLEYPTNRVFAATVTPQYLILGARSWETPDEGPVCGDDEALDTDIRITAVTGTVDGVFIMLARIRQLLSPGGAWTPVAMTGRSCHVRYVRSEFVDVDQDTTIIGTNRHPAVGVDTYRLVSEPA